MPSFPLAQYAPDRAALDPNVTSHLKNAIPTLGGYRPMPSLRVFSSALPAACVGAKVGLTAAGTLTLFAGTGVRLYQLSGTSWNNVTRTVGGDYSATGWSFEQFGPYMFATNINDVLQVFQIGTSTNFAAAAGSPPQAKLVWQESGYLGIGHLQNNERRIMRSGLDNGEFWTVGERGCTYQDLPDGGYVQGMTGFDTGGYVFSQKKIRLLTNQPGQEIGFTLADYDATRGAVAPNSIVRTGAIIAFLTRDGFYILGQPSNPIGAERVDRTFLDDIDVTTLESVQGVSDEKNKMFWWRYRSNSSSATTYTDRLIGYHWQLDRWTYAEVNLEWLISMSTTGYTLEQISSPLGYTNLETVPFSLDSAVWRGGQPLLGGIDSAHKLGFFDGPAMEAMLDSADIPLAGEGKRGFVSGWRLTGDVEGAYGQVGKSDTLSSSATFGPEVVQNVTGLFPVQSSGRKFRFRHRIPAGTVWHDALGIEIAADNARGAGRR